MKIGQLFRRRERKNPVHQPTKVSERRTPLFVETLEDRTVPSGFPDFPVPLIPLPTTASAGSPNLFAELGALASAGLFGGINGPSNIALFTPIVTDLIALSNGTTQVATLLSNATTGSLPGGGGATLQVDALLGNLNLAGLQSALTPSNPDVVSAFLQFMQGLGGIGFPSGLGGSLGSNPGFPFGGF